MDKPPKFDVPEEARKDFSLYDHMGRPVPEQVPRVLSATWCKKVFYKGLSRVGEFDKDGRSGDPIREELVRAQFPQVAVLLVYDSKFQITPTQREYYVYAPQEPQKAAELALRLWQRWERPPRPEFLFGDMREVFPKVEDGVVVHPISDEIFEEHWKDAQRRRHKAAGKQDDPFAFTCLDQDVRLFKTSDFQEGLRVKIR